MSIVERARPEIRALKPYASARSQSAPARVSLDANESPWAPFGDSGLGLNRYPDPQPESLIRSLSAIYGVREDQILATRGSDEAIDLLVRAFCRAGVDAVAQCSPCFGMYAIAAGIQGAGLIDVPLRAESGFALPTDHLITATREAPVRVVFLCSPNNPTGNRMDPESVLEVCTALQGRALVVVDEAYAEFTEGSLVSAVASVDNLAVLRTLSKAWGLAGSRCGVLIAQPEVIELIRRIMPPYPLPTPTIHSVLAAISEEGRAAMRERIQRVQSLRQTVSDRLRTLDAIETVWPSDANFLLVRVRGARELYEFAAEQGVLLRDFSSKPQLTDCIRISIGTAEEMERMFEVLEQWKRP